MHWFFFRLQISHLLLFLLAPSSTAPRGVPAVPWMWRPWLFSSERGEACVGRFVGNAVVGSKAKFSHVLSSEQFSSNTWRFFLAFNSASIGIAFGGRPWELLLRAVASFCLLPVPQLRTNSAATDLYCHCLKSKDWRIWCYWSFDRSRFASFQTSELKLTENCILFWTFSPIKCSKFVV